MPPIPPTPHEAIRNTIALYCIALDTKDFDILRQEVFTQGVEAVYPFDGKAIEGVDALAKRIEERYVCVLMISVIFVTTVVLLGRATLGKRLGVAPCDCAE